MLCVYALLTTLSQISLLAAGSFVERPRLTTLRLKDPFLVREEVVSLRLVERAKREGAKQTAKLLASICKQQTRGDNM